MITPESMHCDRNKCAHIVKGTCRMAAQVKREVELLGNDAWWNTLADEHNRVRYIGNAPPITPDQARTLQIQSVQKNMRRCIGWSCRKQDTALRDALTAYEEATKPFI